MNKFIKVDENGFFVEDVFFDDEELEELKKDENSILKELISTDCPEGFYKPKWDGNAWVESADEEYIVKIKAEQKAEDQLHEEITYLQEAIADLYVIISNNERED